MSALVPGTGQLFLRKRRKAIAIIIVLATVSLGFWPLRLPRSYFSLVSMIWVLLLLSLFAVYDALFTRDTSTSQRVSWWWVLAAIPLHYVGFNILFTALLFGSGFHTARNVGSSMEPTLPDGSRFVYDTAYYRSHPVRRGDVVVLRVRDRLFIKRVAAIGGDTVEGREGKILLNGEPLSEPTIWHKFPPGTYASLDTFHPVTVPPGKYFVLGDNLDMSNDSRSFGLVDANAIVGKALYSYQFAHAPLSSRLD